MNEVARLSLTENRPAAEPLGRGFGSCFFVQLGSAFDASDLEGSNFFHAVYFVRKHTAACLQPKVLFKFILFLRIDLLASRWWVSLCNLPCLFTASLLRAGPTMCLWPPASVSICVGRQAFCVHGKMRAKACVF